MGFQSYRLPARKSSKHSKTFQTLQTLQNPPNPPTTVPSRDPKAKATSRTGTPGPRPQQWLSIGFQSCRLPANAPNLPNPPNPPKHPPKPSQTLQTPSPASTPGPRPLPEQAPQGQGHSNGFLWAFNAAVCQPANAPNPPKFSKLFKPSKTLQPNPPNTLPSRHPRAKATSPTGTPGPRPQHSFLWVSKLPFASPHTLQTFQNFPNPPNPPKPSKPSKHPLQQAPQGQGHFPNRHPRAKATAMAFYGLSKLPFASPQTLQTLQNPPKPPNPPKPSKPSKHPPKPSKPSKHLPQQAPQGQGHFPNRHPRSVYLSIHPSTHPSIYPSLSLSLSLSVSLSLSPQCPPNRGGSAAPGR